MRITIHSVNETSSFKIAPSAEIVKTTFAESSSFVRSPWKSSQDAKRLFQRASQRNSNRTREINTKIQVTGRITAGHWTLLLFNGGSVAGFLGRRSAAVAIRIFIHALPVSC